VVGAFDGTAAEEGDGGVLSAPSAADEEDVSVDDFGAAAMELPVAGGSSAGKSANF